MTAAHRRACACLAAAAGDGIVSSDLPGISCGETCEHDYALTTVVTLTATPSVGQFFVGWEGACSGTGTCKVTMEDVARVTASFALSGWCTARFPRGVPVTLTSAYTKNNWFGPPTWGGACAATTGATCTVTLDGDATVTVTYP